MAMSVSGLVPGLSLSLVAQPQQRLHDIDRMDWAADPHLPRRLFDPAPGFGGSSGLYMHALRGSMLKSDGRGNEIPDPVGRKYFSSALSTSSALPLPDTSQSLCEKLASVTVVHTGETVRVIRVGHEQVKLSRGLEYSDLVKFRHADRHIVRQPPVKVLGLIGQPPGKLGHMPKVWSKASPLSNSLIGSNM